MGVSAIVGVIIGTAFRMGVVWVTEYKDVSTNAKYKIETTK